MSPQSGDAAVAANEFRLSHSRQRFVRSQTPNRPPPKNKRVPSLETESSVIGAYCDTKSTSWPVESDQARMPRFHHGGTSTFPFRRIAGGIAYKPQAARASEPSGVNATP